MKTSSTEKVRELYENSAESYAALMDEEIDLPIYSDILSRLADRIAAIPGPVVDTSCGPGHMLFRFRDRYDSDRSLVGIDLSPRMVEIATEKLKSGAEMLVGDMRNLDGVETGSAAAALSFFALHHLGPEEVPGTLREWWRILRPKGQLVVAAWEGTGAIDYEGEMDLLALRYSRDEVVAWAEGARFVVNRCVVEPVEGMPMNAVYLEGTKES
jgi:ubiquinone/menaquinone biosynthesis C-methylase UbiE